LEILKRKLIELNFKIELIWDFKGSNLNTSNKSACMKVNIKGGDEFLHKNSENFKGIYY